MPPIGAKQNKKATGLGRTFGELLTQGERLKTTRHATVKSAEKSARMTATAEARRKDWVSELPETFNVIEAQAAWEMELRTSAKSRLLSLRKFGLVQEATTPDGDPVFRESCRVFERAAIAKTYTSRNF